MSITSTDEALESITTSAGPEEDHALVAPLEEPKVGMVATFVELFAEVYQYRELLWQMTLRDLRLRYKQAVMGFGWAIFMPVIIVLAGVLVKFAMAQIAGKEIGAGGIAGMASKSLPWAFFVGSVGFATTSLTTNMFLITRIYFPREMFPLSAVIVQLVDSAIGSSVLAILLFLVLKVPIGWPTLWAIPMILLLVVFTCGIGLFLSCSNLFFRDVKYIVQILLTFGIFFTPVLYDAQDFGARGSMAIMLLNPIAPILEGIRLSVVEQQNLLVSHYSSSGFLIWHPLFLLYTTVISGFTFFFSAIMFHKLEFVYAEYI